jgi:hypothetical protein
MSSSIVTVTNPYKTPTENLDRKTEDLQTKREAVNAKASEKAQAAGQSASDAVLFARSAGQTAWMGAKETGHGVASVAVGAAQAGAGAGFAVAGAAGWVGEGVAKVTRKALGGIANGFLALANALARAAGKQVAKTDETPVAPRTKPTFSERMFAKMREKFGASKASFGASGNHFVTGAKVGVLGTAANLGLATASSAVAVGRIASAGVLKVQAASIRGAEVGVGIASVSVKEGAKGGAEVLARDERRKLIDERIASRIGVTGTLSNA